MERIDLILKHELFQYHLQENLAAEADRRFCRHNMGHFLDVARIARILNAEEGAGEDAELIYAAALLHDLGKHLQYSDRIPHEKASAAIAPKILADCGFSEEESAAITDAIAGHRDPDSASVPGLTGLLYRADKLSRACYACPAENQCNWKGDRKNLHLNY